MSELTVGNLNAIAYHLEQGMDNGNITKDALALFLRSVANDISNVDIELDRLKNAMGEVWKTNFKAEERLRKAIQMVALAVGDNEHGWKKEHVKLLQEYLEDNLDVLTGDGV